MLNRAKLLINNAELMCREIIEVFEKDHQFYADEDDVTSRLIERITDGLNFNSGSSQIKSRLIKLKKKEESDLGGDVLILTSFVSNELEVYQGVIIQAKIIKDAKSIGSQREMDRLQKQCSDMHEKTKQAYVWLYDVPSSGHEKIEDRKGPMRKYQYKSLRASLVENLQTIYPHDAFFVPLSKFFKDIMSGYIGDMDLNIKDQKRIVGLIESLNISNVLLISSDVGPDLNPTIENDFVPNSDISADFSSLLKDFQEAMDEANIFYETYPRDSNDIEYPEM